MAGIDPTTSDRIVPLNSTRTATAESLVSHLKTMSLARRRPSTAARETVDPADTPSDFNAMSDTSCPHFFEPAKGKAPPAPFPGVGLVRQGEQRLAAAVLDLRRPHLLHVGDDAGRHRHVVEILGHALALGVGP